MIYNPNDVNTWPGFKPLIIAHDVGRSHDRSTAVVGGNSPLDPVDRTSGVLESCRRTCRQCACERAHGGRRRYGRNALIVADLSNDATYAEVLYETYGPRVIGLHITRQGNGMTFEVRPVKGGWLPVYTIGRTHLLELFLSEFRSEQVRFADEPTMRRAYEQLVNLDVEFRDSGTVYSCPVGQHDDLGISCAMLAWAARHLHLVSWMRNLEAALRPRKRREKFNWDAVN